jgi:putative flippase GtrA
MLRLVFIGSPFIVKFFPILFGALMLLVIIKNRQLILKLPRFICTKNGSISLYVLFFIGLCLRLMWAFFFNAEPGSDGATYLALAEKIVNGAEYEIANTKAYWPVGFPLYLSVWLLILPNTKVAYLVSNLFIYIVSFLGIYKATTCSNKEGLKLSIIMFVLWPNLVFNTATPEKELLVLGLLAWSFYLFIQSIVLSTFYQSFFCGLLLGGCTLIQPSLQFLPILVLVIFFILIYERKLFFLKSLFLILGVVIIVTPWTIRNYHVFGEYVLVSTNGGDNLYRANNPLATGGYTEKGEFDLDNLNELEKDQFSKKLAKKWILENPFKFAELVLEKQIRFIGDDSVGVYNTLKVGKASNNTILYIALKTLSNAWWLFVWLILGSFAFDAILLDKKVNILFSLSLWIWLYLFVIHSVFESAGKYHLPVLWVLIILIGIYSDNWSNNDLNFDLSNIAKNQASTFCQFKKFFIIGGFSTCLQYGFLILLVQFFRVGAAEASAVGFVLSAIFNYYLNYTITFGSNASHNIVVPKFILTASSGLMINTGVIWLVLNVLDMHYLIAQILATCIVLVWNFTVNKIWVFGNTMPVRY